MTPFETILVFLLGGIGMQAIVVDDRSLTNALPGISAIAFVDVTPIVMVEDGHWHEDRIHRVRLHPQDIMAAAREDGLVRMEQIQFAVVERNGSVSVVRKEKG